MWGEGSGWDLRVRPQPAAASGNLEIYENHESWSEMGPYGSIWLDTAAKMIVRTLRIFFGFKKSLKIGLWSKKEARDSKQVLPRGPKKRPMIQFCSSKI